MRAREAVFILIYFLVGCLCVTVQEDTWTAAQTGGSLPPAEHKPEVDLAVPRNLVTTDVPLKVVRMRAVEVVRAVAVSEVQVTKRSGAHMSTVMDDIEGGGYVTFARCRQGFSVVEVLAGEGNRGSRQIEYAFVEKAEGFPLPDEESPIPKGAEVVLALGADGRLLKVLAGTDPSGQTIDQIVRGVKSRPPAAKALIKAIDSFSLKIEYHGAKTESYYSIICTTSRQRPENLPANWLVMQNLSTVWAYQALDHLVSTGVLDPEAIRAEGERSAAKEPFYSLTVSAQGTEQYTHHLGWGKQAHDRLAALAKAIQYDGGKMAKLLAPLKGPEETPGT